MTTAVVKFQLRRDTADNWLNSTVYLEEGEPGFDITNNILKIGPKGGALWKDIGIMATTNSIGSVLITGENTGENQADNSSNDPAFIVKPIRTVRYIPSGFFPLYWNSTTGEIIQVTP
jgi:hypothetical protein